MPLLVSGYKRMGKDTFYENVVSGKDLNTIYDFYANPEVNIELFRVIVHSSPKRYGFADNLKITTASCLGVSLEKLDEIKDQEVVSTYHFRMTPLPTIVTPRDIMIDIAALNRSGNDRYYVDEVVNNIGPYDIVTDHRYPNETQAMYEKWPDHTITAMVFRPDVPLPKVTDKSERSLDCEVPDIIIVNRGTGDSYLTSRSKVRV